MITFTRQEGLTRIGDPYLLHGKIREKIRQQIPAGQVLPTLEGMRYIPLEGYLRQEKGFGLLDKPNP
jgi:hypothetical protein